MTWLEGLRIEGILCGFGFSGSWGEPETRDLRPRGVEALIPAACGTNKSDRKRRFDPALRAGGRTGTRTSIFETPRRCTSWFRATAVERTWHTQDRQGQILAMPSRLTSFKGFQVLPGASCRQQLRGSSCCQQL